VQDIGMIASTPAFGATEPRSEFERERMRLHPYYTERLLARSHALAPIGSLASLHHERLDGSGSYRGLSAAQLPLTARILAVAEVYAALTEVQPHRAAMTPVAAAEELRKDVRAGRLDDMAVRAVLAAAGQRIRRRLPTRIAGLTNREIEVLRLLSEGLVNHQMAERLSISTHTVDHHIEHIYDKIDVSTRAEAVRFAIQQQLLGPWDTESAPIRAKK
jgi:HD-GYP domain-containing protein (c-di-GMP phosphodiesterase class II)